MIFLGCESFLFIFKNTFKSKYYQIKNKKSRFKPQIESHKKKLNTSIKSCILKVHLKHNMLYKKDYIRKGLYNSGL